MTAAGLKTIASAFGPEETMHWLDTAVQAMGMNVFARIDHAAGARQAGLELRETVLLIFGNARGGTPLMQSVQTIGIDLPLKALVWQDDAGKTFLSYNDPNWLAARHGAGPKAQKAIDAISAALDAIARRATEPSEAEAPE